MALSNWDCLAFDEDGKPCSGTFRLRGDAEAEIYKNWLHILHPSAWFEGNGFSDGIVMSVDSGYLEYAGCDIVVERHSFQEACFVFIGDRRYDEPRTTRIFAGIGCSAYMDLVEWMKRNDPRKLDLLPSWWREAKSYWEFSSFGSDDDGGRDGVGITLCREDDSIESVCLYGLDEEPNTYVGVTPELHRAFVRWLDGVCDDERWLEIVRSSDPVRFNQGDAFFASHMGIDDVSTPIGGQAGTTIMDDLIGSSGESGRDHSVETESTSGD